MNEVPLVSVVVPVYNHEKYIQECIRSVLDQDHPRIELIVINDGSTDATESRIEELRAKASRPFRHLRKQNEGLIKTLNLGLSLASGSYFCELSSDDVLFPGSLSRRLAFLQANPEVDVIACDALVLHGDEITEERLVRERGYDSSKHGVLDLLNQNAWIHFAGLIYKTSVLRKLGGYDEDFRRASDLCLMCPLALEANIAYLDEPLVGYRFHDDNISTGRPVWVQREMVLAIEKLLRRVEHDRDLAASVRDYLYRAYLRLASRGIRQGGMDRRELLEVLAKARRLRPLSPKPLYYRFYRSHVGWRRKRARHPWR